MDDLARMAAGYRAEAARMKLKLREMKAAGADRYRILHLAEVLRETRRMAHAMSHYYDTPRDPAVTGAGYYAPKGKRHDD